MDTACPMNTKTREKRCLNCVFHSSPAELGGRFHLCILPPDCAPPAAADDDDHWHDQEVESRTYLGTSCDVMRRMGAACGPHAAMWCEADASTPSASKGDAA
jgi:hypothetical protein